MAMSAREKTVIRAIIKALRQRDKTDMDAYATSYSVPPYYLDADRSQKAGILLQALIDAT